MGGIRTVVALAAVCVAVGSWSCVYREPPGASSSGFNPCKLRAESCQEVCHDEVERFSCRPTADESACACTERGGSRLCGEALRSCTDRCGPAQVSFTCVDGIPVCRCPEAGS